MPAAPRYREAAAGCTVSDHGDVPDVNFSIFVSSLASSAMVHLGQTPDPDSGRRDVDLALARSTIDALGMLEEKTRGNLDAEEQSLLTSLLAELRTKFVEVSQARRAGG